MRFVLPDGTPTALRAGDVIELHTRQTITIKRIEDGAVMSIHIEKAGAVSRTMKCSDVTSSSKFPCMVEFLAAACRFTAEKSEDSNYHHCVFKLRT